MNGMGEAAGIGAAMWVIMVVIAALIIAAVAGLIWWLGTPYGVRRGRGRDNAIRVLEERYARGEIPEQEYRRKRQQLEA